MINERQPIDTAPKDGRNIIVFWCDETDQEYAAIAWFRTWVEVCDLGGDWKPDDEGWWTYINSHTQEMIHPTHWIPLPKVESK